MTVSLPDGGSAELLIGYINQLKELADEIRERQEAMTEICKSAKESGFSGPRLREVVAWLGKIEKHGIVEMEQREALFDLYRTVHQGGSAKSFEDILANAGDRALAAKFVGDDQIEQRLNQRRKNMTRAADMARGAREARSL